MTFYGGSLPFPYDVMLADDQCSVANRCRKQECTQCVDFIFQSSNMRQQADVAGVDGTSLHSVKHREEGTFCESIYSRFRLRLYLFTISSEGKHICCYEL